MAYNSFPYSNFHELNLDYLLNKSKEIEGNVQETSDNVLRATQQADRSTQQAVNSQNSATASARSATASSQSAVNSANSAAASAQSATEARAAAGDPKTFTAATQLTDTTKIYVYVGETGTYTYGHYYYYQGGSWHDGGVYGTWATDDALSDSSTNAVQNKVVNAAVSELKSDINVLADTQELYLFNETVSGSVMKQIFVAIPAGTYTLKIDNVTSSDTQYQTSRITFLGAGGASQSFDMSRQYPTDRSITVSFDITSIAFYGAHNYSDSAGVTFAYNNVRIITATGLSVRLETIEGNVTENQSNILDQATDIALVVNPVSITETPGYFGESGNINPASYNNKEVYTNKIPIGVNLLHWAFDFKDGTTRNLWIACMRYDKNENVIGTRVTLYNGDNTAASGTLSLSDDVAFVSFTYRTFGISDVFHVKAFTNPDILSNTKHNLDGMSGYVFPLAHDKHFGHLLLNYVDEGNAYQRIIPCQSVFDVEMTARLGYKYMEANVHKTATSGKYVVTHGISGKLGNDFETINGENVPAVVIAETPYDTLRSGYRYKSVYAKYKVPITSLEEFLYACRTWNVFPVLQYVDETELDIARSIVGDNMILYGGNRSVFNGFIMEYLNLTTETEIINRCKNVGKPYMYNMGNTSTFTDTQLKSIVSKVHALGCYIGNVGAYDGVFRTGQLMNLGFDFSASGGMVNDFRDGNIINIVNDPAFSGVVTTGTVSNGTIVLSDGDTITVESSDNSFLKKYSVDVDFVGTLIVTMPNKIGKNDTVTGTIISDGTQTTRLSGSLLNRLLNATLTASGNVTITGLSIKMSKC